MNIRPHGQRQRVSLGRFGQQDINRMLSAAAQIPGTGRRIAFISSGFVNIPYANSTIIGGPNKPELLTINLQTVDCFTFLDYIEAMRLSHNFASFAEALKAVRYRGGKVSYESRNHFFTSWIDRNAHIKDMTADVAGKHIRHVHKRLNDREDGTYFVPGIEPIDRDIAYIPGKAIDSQIIRRLRTGDYIGIYSNKKGLDVSHVGILIKEKKAILFRHASSLAHQRRVLDEDFMDYAGSRPGIIVLRGIA